MTKACASFNLFLNIKILSTMKKQIKKLKLNKQTVQVLTVEEQSKIVGGKSNNRCQENYYSQGAKTIYWGQNSVCVCA